MGPMVFTAELAGVGVCSRTQVPLKLAWAITGVLRGAWVLAEAAFAAQ